MRAPLSDALSYLLAVSTAFMLWKGLSLATNSSHPIMVVISESMAPAFHRGDLIFLWNRTERIHAGDIPVLWFSEHALPMVHRAISVQYGARHDSSDSIRHILTKGDNNKLDDVAMYPPGRRYALRSEVVGLVRGFVPWLGWLTIVPRDIMARMSQVWAIGSSK